MDGSFNDKVENKPKKEPLSYLKILHLPSFQDKRKKRILNKAIKSNMIIP